MLTSIILSSTLVIYADTYEAKWTPRPEHAERVNDCSVVPWWRLEELCYFTGDRRESDRGAKVKTRVFRDNKPRTLYEDGGQWFERDDFPGDPDNWPADRTKQVGGIGGFTK